MKLAIPLAFVVAVAPLSVTPGGAPVIAADTVTFGSLTAFPLASLSCTTGCGLSATPACAVPAGCVLSVSCVLEPALSAIVADVTPVRVPLLNPRV